MAIRDILLFMTSYPYRTPTWAIEASSSLAEELGAQLSTALCQTHLPNVSNWLADKLVHANELIAIENRKGKFAAQELLAEFVSMVGDTVRGEQVLIDSASVIPTREIGRRARLHDLIIIPVEDNLEYKVVAEGLVFDSGRPVLLLPQSGGSGRRIEKVMIGWDSSRAATRALADAMPFLLAAKTIRLLLVTGEKEVNADHSFSDIQRHLRLHGADADSVEIPANGRDAGNALMTYCIEQHADLLVMGAFGHSKAREFVLGGATRSVLDNPQISVLLAH